MVMMTWRIKTRSSLVTEHKVTVAYAMHEAHWNGVSRHCANDKDSGYPRTESDALSRRLLNAETKSLAS
jgi:hypothetical protein